MFISFLDSDIIISPSDIQLSEVLGLRQLIYKLLDQWQRILVLDCFGVKEAIVLDRVQSSILLFDEEEG